MNVKDSKIYTTSDGGYGMRFNEGASGSIVDISGQSIIATCGGKNGTSGWTRAVDIRGSNISFSILEKTILTSGLNGGSAALIGPNSSIIIKDEACVYGGLGGLDDCFTFSNANELNINTAGIVVGTNMVGRTNTNITSVNIKKGTFGSTSQKKPFELLSSFMTDASSTEGNLQEVDFKYLTNDGELQSKKIKAYIVEIGK